MLLLTTRVSTIMLFKCCRFLTLQPLYLVKTLMGTSGGRLRWGTSNGEERTCLERDMRDISVTEFVAGEGVSVFWRQ